MQQAIDAAQAAGISPHPLTGWKRAAFVRFVLDHYGPSLLANWNLPNILSNPETA